MLSINRMRSGLTVLGIVIGVATVVVISSVITGLDHSVDQLIAQLGTNVIFVTRYATFGARPTIEELLRKQLTDDDTIALGQLPHVVAASAGLRYLNFGPYGSAGMTRLKSRTKAADNVGLGGETSDSLVVNDWDIADGRFFTQEEDIRSARVAILGSDTAEQLFPDGNAVGKDVNISGVIATVIGTLRPSKSLASGRNPDDNYCYIPLSTFRHLHPEVTELWISVKFDDPLHQEVVRSEIEELLRVRRRVPSKEDNNFAIFGSDVLTKLWNEVSHGLFLLMLSISSISLFVGGIGVMNVMLVSVTERTREIGLRKAVGATKVAILCQFTVEAVTLCAIGGICGIILGGTVAGLLHIVLPCDLSAAWVCTSFTMACLVGIVFGVYPAWVAAHLDPVEALRYE
jgi:putative ABC transport system permease protein